MRWRHGRLRPVIACLMIFASLAIHKPVEASASKPLPCRQWHALLREHGLPVRIFAPIMWRESRCEPKAVGWNYRSGRSHKDCRLSHASTYRRCKAVRSYDVGLLQINSSWKSVTARACQARFGEMLVLQDPVCNLTVASILYAGGKGLSNWSATSGNIASD